MSYQCLADFLEELGQAGELVRVEAEVEPVLEAAEITSRIAHAGGPALLFGSVRGHTFPLVANLLGTEARIAMALGVESAAEISRRIAELVNPSLPEGWFEKIKNVPTRAALGELSPRTVKTGACQQVVKLGGDIDLAELPALKSGPLEPGRVITAGQVFTTDAESGQSSVGRYDLRVLAPDRLAVCWSPHEDPARLILGYAERNSRMPLALVLGGDPAGLLAAMAPLTPDADASAVAGLLRGKPRELVNCRTVDLQVPTDAEIVIEGCVDPAEPPVDAGPLRASGGSYQPSAAAPVMHLTALTHRANPIYPAMVPGFPPDEICVVNRFLKQVFLPLVQLAIPELVDYDLPMFAAARRWATLSIRKTYAGQARRVAHAAWGLRQMMFAKVLVVVDEEVDVHLQNQVLSAIAANVNPGRDVFFGQGPPDPLDPASGAGQLGQKMAIDATTKLPAERGGEQHQPAAMSPEIRQLVTDRWVEYGLGPAAD